MVRLLIHYVHSQMTDDLLNRFDALHY